MYYVRQTGNVDLQGCILSFNNLIATIHDTRSHEQLSNNNSILASFEFFQGLNFTKINVLSS